MMARARGAETVRALAYEELRHEGDRLPQGHHARLVRTLPILCAALVAPLTCPAAILSGSGNQPVRDPGWPEGALAVANLESRIGWWEGPPFGGGEWHFLYQGNTEGFKEALAAFAAIRAPALDLVIQDGPHEDSLLNERVDWAFTVWVPASWDRLFNNPKSVFEADSPHFRQPVAPPRLSVYVGGGQVDWEKVKLPAGINLRDERAGAAPVHPVGGAEVRADIYDMATGKPVVGARVTVARKTNIILGRPLYENVAETVSDATGHVEITKIPAGTYRVTAEAEGYATRLVGYERFGDRTFKQFTVELARAAVLSGRATDMNGRPLRGVSVYTSSVMAMDGRGYQGQRERSVESDAEGHFQFAGLPVGYVQLGARAQGYYFNDLFTIHDVPATNVLLRLGSAGAIHVSVTDNEGHPLSRYDGREIMVEVEPKGGSKVRSWGGSAKVKDDGTFDFNNVQPGEYRVTSHPNPYSSNRQYTPEQSITVTPGKGTTVKVVYE